MADNSALNASKVSAATGGLLRLQLLRNKLLSVCGQDVGHSAFFVSSLHHQALFDVLRNHITGIIRRVNFYPPNGILDIRGGKVLKSLNGFQIVAGYEDAFDIALYRDFF